MFQARGVPWWLRCRCPFSGHFLSGFRTRCACVRTASPLLAGDAYGNIRRMVSLTDTELQSVMLAARGLPVEKRSVFLQRVASDLELRQQAQRVDVDRAITTALSGLIQQSADALTPRQ
jgi:hypothetical protein